MIDKETFMNLWGKIEASNSGEPGFLFTNDKDAGTNPCAEINLKANQFCNLCEINASDIETQESLIDIVTYDIMVTGELRDEIYRSYSSFILWCCILACNRIICR